MEGGRPRGKHSSPVAGVERSGTVESEEAGAVTRILVPRSVLVVQVLLGGRLKDGLERVTFFCFSCGALWVLFCAVVQKMCTYCVLRHLLTH